jgi:GntR family transcriptional regulator
VLIVIDADSGVPVYRQLMDQVRFQVASGLLAAGDELPSTRVLSQELGINPMTVSKAYALLEEEGLVERRAGLPLVVSQRGARAAVRQKEAQLRVLLEPAAVAARQLGFTSREALSVFRAALADADSAMERGA